MPVPELSPKKPKDHRRFSTVEEDSIAAPKNPQDNLGFGGKPVEYLWGKENESYCPQCGEEISDAAFEAAFSSAKGPFDNRAYLVDVHCPAGHRVRLFLRPGSTLYQRLKAAKTRSKARFSFRRFHLRPS